MDDKVCIGCNTLLKRGHRSTKQWAVAKYCSNKCEGASRSGARHHNWKGDEASYIALHAWVQRKLGKPTICENCGKDGLSGHRIHWANKSREYRRDIADWKRLCVSCHSKYDKTWVNRTRAENGQFAKAIY